MKRRLYDRNITIVNLAPYILIIVCYNSEDAGDISIKASVNNILSNEIYIEDIFKYYKLDGTESVFTILLLKCNFTLKKQY